MIVSLEIFRSSAVQSCSNILETQFEDWHSYLRAFLSIMTETLESTFLRLRLALFRESM